MTREFPNTSIVRYFIVLVAIFSLITLPTATRGQGTNLNKLGITVSPVTDEFVVKPGTTVVREVKVTNPVRDVVTLYPQVLNFTTDNEQGQPTFYTLAEKNSRYALSAWVSFSKEFIRVAPNENEVVNVTVKAPDNAEPGGHYGAILFSTEKPEVKKDVSQVSVVGLIGSLFLATVPGDVTQKLTLDDYDAPHFLINPPAKFSLLFSNTGNIHEKPQGELKIRNWFGDTVKTLKINEGGGNVLPDSKRRFDIGETIDKKFVTGWQFDWKAVGRYTTTAVIAYGNPEQQLQAVRSFFIIPLWLIIAVGAVILLIISWIVAARRRKVKVRTFSTPPTPSNVPTPPKTKGPIVMR